MSSAPSDMWWLQIQPPHCYLIQAKKDPAACQVSVHYLILGNQSEHQLKRLNDLPSRIDDAKTCLQQRCTPL